MLLRTCQRGYVLCGTRGVLCGARDHLHRIDVGGHGKNPSADIFSYTAYECSSCVHSDLPGDELKLPECEHRPI